MHRNTLLLTAALAVIAALVVGVNIGRNLSPAQAPIPSPTVTITPSPITTLQYKSTKCGVSLSYPSNLQVNESTTSATAFIDATHPEQSTILICQHNIPRAALSPDKIESVTIHSETSAATISAKLYHDTSAKDGTPVDALIFTNAKKGFDVYIAGFGQTFQSIIASVKVL